MKHYIQLIGFDGRYFWRLFYVEIIDKKEIYYGFVKRMEKEQLSFSRHGSGQLNIKIGHVKQRITDIIPQWKTIPLRDLKHIEFLGTFNPLPEKQKLTEKEYIKYVSKKCSAVFLMDLRNYEGTVNIQVAIVNPESKEEVMKLNNFDHKCQIFIYTSSNPWLVFYILNVPNVQSSNENSFLPNRKP